MSIFSRLKRFQRLQSGNVAMMVGLMFGVVFTGTGGAIDVTAAHKLRAELQDIVDRASLYAARNEEADTQEIKALVDSAVAKLNASGGHTVTLERNNGIADVKINGASENRFLHVVGLKEFDINVESRAAVSTGLSHNVEIALVLDNTESMADDMPALRAAALELVSSIYDAGESRVKISVVPYAGAVNIGADAPLTWMDTGANSAHHAVEIEGVQVKFCSTSGTTTETNPPECTAICGCPGTVACGGGGDGAFLSVPGASRFASSDVLNRIAALVTPSEAEAASHNYAAPAADACPAYTPNKINVFDLLDAIPNTDWMGCVEARPAPFDVTDAPPVGSTADSLFVPYMWYDDADSYDATAVWLNNYLVDATGLTQSGNAIINGNHESRRASIYKYDGITIADIDETGTSIIGPNRGCPDPVLRLSDNRATVESKIQSLTHRDGGGTIIPQGLVWGWRALSPSAPMEEGAPYDDLETKKIIVLLSDGANAIQKRGEPGRNDLTDQDVYGDYTAYGYAGSFRNGDEQRGFFDIDAEPSVAYFDRVRNYLDSRMEEVCDNIKAASEDNPIEIFTVLVGDHDARTQGLMSSCATSEITHYHNASAIQSLSNAFGAIAGEIVGAGQVRIVR